MTAIASERYDVVCLGEVLVEVHEEGGTRVRARLPQTVTGRYVDFIAPVPG